MRNLLVLLFALPPLLSGCDPIWRHRIVVSARPAGIAGAEPSTRRLARAAVRYVCPPGDYLPIRDTRPSLTGEDGEVSLGGTDFGVSTACAIEVSRAGYATRRYSVADACAVERPRGRSEERRVGEEGGSRG